MPPKAEFYHPDAVQQAVLAIGQPCPQERLTYLMSMHDLNRTGGLNQYELDRLLADAQGPGSSRIHKELELAWQYVTQMSAQLAQQRGGTR